MNNLVVSKTISKEEAIEFFDIYNSIITPLGEMDFEKIIKKFQMIEIRKTIFEEEIVLSLYAGVGISSYYLIKMSDMKIIDRKRKVEQLAK